MSPMTRTTVGTGNWSRGLSRIAAATVVPLNQEMALEGSEEGRGEHRSQSVVAGAERAEKRLEVFGAAL